MSDFFNTVQPWEDTELPSIQRWMLLAQCWVRATRRWRENPTKQEFEDEHFYYVMMARPICEMIGESYASLYDFWEYMSAKPKDRLAIGQRQSEEHAIHERLLNAQARSC